jgi:hypothetical protein
MAILSNLHNETKFWKQKIIACFFQCTYPPKNFTKYFITIKYKSVIFIPFLEEEAEAILIFFWHNKNGI